MTLAYEIVKGLAYLNKRGITHRNLSQENILFNKKVHVFVVHEHVHVCDRCILIIKCTDICPCIKRLSVTSIFFILQGKVKLSEYGLYYMTEYGADVAFPIGSGTICYSTINFIFSLEKTQKK